MNRKRLAASLSTRVARDPLLQLLRECALDSGAEVYLGGGPVRDAALQRPCKDADLTVVRRGAPLVRELKRRLGTRGFRFRKRGITTWRFATSSGEVDVVDAVRRGLEHDLHRRELTINAMAYDLVGRRLVDPLSGLKDLRAKRLRAPGGDTFREDPARCLRAGLNRLNPMCDLAAGHHRTDVWRHTVKTIEMSATRHRLPSFRAVRDRGELPLLRWTLLLHDIAKPVTFAVDRSGKPTFHGHEERGAKLADAVLRRLRFDARTRRRITQLMRFHLRPGHLADAGAPLRGMRRLAREAGDDLDLLCLHAACDAQGSG